MTALIWCATFPATKSALEQIPPFSFLFLRFFLGAVLVGLWFAVIRRQFCRNRAMLVASAIATVFLFLAYSLQTIGLRYTGASNSAFLTALYVVFVPLIPRRFDTRVLLATTIAVIGLWLLVKPSMSVNVGDLMTLGCAVAFAGHIICLERFTRQMDTPSLLVWQLAAATLLLSLAIWWEQALASAFMPTSVLLIGLGVIGGLATGAFAVQVWTQQIVPAQQVALVFASESACAAWISWYFLRETLDFQGWAGSALVLLAVVLGTFERRIEPHSPPAKVVQLL